MSTVPTASAPTAAPAASSTPSATPSASSAPAVSKTAAPTASASKPSDAPPPVRSGNQGGDPGGSKIGQQEAAPAPETMTQAEVKEEIRKHKLKINGKEREYDEHEVIRLAQLSAGAHEKFSEASDMRKQAEQFFEAFLSDPKSVLMHPDIKDKINFRQLAEEFLGGELQRELMSPEEIELQELREFKKSQTEQRERSEKEALTRTQKEEMGRLQQRAAQEYDRKITEALNQSNLPKNASTVKRVAELLHGALSKGYELDIQTAVDMVRESHSSDVQSLLGDMDGEALIALLGDGITKKLRKYDLARIKQQLEPQQSQAPAAVGEQRAPVQRKPAEGPQNYRPDAWREKIFAKMGIKD